VCIPLWPCVASLNNNYSYYGQTQKFVDYYVSSFVGANAELLKLANFMN